MLVALSNNACAWLMFPQRYNGFTFIVSVFMFNISETNFASYLSHTQSILGLAEPQPSQL